jgi:hypothetical protein
VRLRGEELVDAGSVEAVFQEPNHHPERCTRPPPLCHLSGPPRCMQLQILDCRKGTINPKIYVNQMKHVIEESTSALIFICHLLE